MNVLSAQDQVREIGRLGNYGAGDYINKCWECGRQFVGAKLATNCLGCAVKYVKEMMVQAEWQSRNINGYIRVKLTDIGREQIIKNHNKLFGEHASRYEVDMPKPNEDGWCEMQIWEVMNQFGEHMGNGRPLMIETEIQFGKRQF